MHHQAHRYTNMEQFKQGMNSHLRLPENEFEVIYSEQNESERFEESHLPFLRKEDEKIQTLQVYLSRNFKNFIPCKSSAEMTSIFDDENMMKINGDKIQFYCQKHPKKKAGFLCLNKSCDHVMYCMSCRKDHDQNCNRRQMVMNIKDIEDKDFANDYFDIEDYNYEEQTSKVKELVQTQREKMNEMLDLFEKTMISKIKMQGMEFKLKQMKEGIEDRHKHFKGNS
jgi:hypothetical protein